MSNEKLKKYYDAFCLLKKEINLKFTLDTNLKSLKQFKPLLKDLQKENLSKYTKLIQFLHKFGLPRLSQHTLVVSEYITNEQCKDYFSNQIQEMKIL